MMHTVYVIKCIACRMWLSTANPSILMLWFPFCRLTILHSKFTELTTQKAEPISYSSISFTRPFGVFFLSTIHCGTYQTINVHLNAIPLWYRANTKQMQQVHTLLFENSIYWYDMNGSSWIEWTKDERKKQKQTKKNKNVFAFKTQCKSDVSDFFVLLLIYY